jgi:hypothetical protein
MMRRHLAPVAVMVALLGFATRQAAADDALAFDATAQIGARSLAARIHFACSSNAGRNVTGVLSVALETPNYEQLRSVFDFDSFEGPDANVGALSGLQAFGASGKAGNRFTAAGSAVDTKGALSFVLEIDASRREPGALHKLAAVLRPLLDVPSRLVWRQSSATKTSAPIVATLDLSPAQTVALRGQLGPCLAGR